METVSEKFREQVYKGSSLYNAILTINDNLVPTSQIASIKIKSPIIDTSTETFYVGSFISQSITIKFKNLDGLDIASNNNVSLQIGQLVDNNYEYVYIGKYLIDDLDENYQQTCEITCLDYAVKFKPNIDYSPCFVDDKTDVNTIIRYICEYFGVELETDIDSLPNGDIEVGTFDSTISGKQWLSYLAEIKGCNLKMSRQGKLLFIPLKKEPVVKINALASKTWNLGEKYKISRVVYFDAVRNFTSGVETDNTLFIRQDNPFITNQEVIDNIYEAVNGFEVWSLKNENFGDISLDAWDIIEFTLGEETYQTFNDNNITFEMTIMTTIDTQIPNKQKEITTNVIGGDTQTKLKILKTNLDYINQQIELLIRENDGLTERTNQLVMDLLSTQNIFQITGGSNSIINSQFLYDDPIDRETNSRTYWNFEDNGNNPYNNLSEGYDAQLIGKTTSIAKIQLRDTIATTTYENITGLKRNQVYTLNYSYTQDELTTTNFQLFDEYGNIVTYNVLNEEDETYEIKEIDFTYDSEQTTLKNETIQFVAPTSTLILKITTNTTSGDTTKGYFYLYDLMLNSGDKKNWQPAPSEVWSTVVKMSQLGLSVVAEGSKIITLLTSMGFQVREYANGQIAEIITEFDDTGLITGVARTKETHTGNYVMKEITINGVEHHIEYFKES